MNLWGIEKNGFDNSDIELHGSKYLIGNGYMGYRGTMEEYTAKELVAVNLAGLFDKNGDKWRESVNAPNPFYTAVAVNGEKLKLGKTNIISHIQSLDIKRGIHTRKTIFSVGGIQITVSAERFLSMKRSNIMALKYSVSANKDVSATLSTGIDTEIWDINGPHIKDTEINVNDNDSVFTGKTIQNEIEIKVYENVSGVEFKKSSNELHCADIELGKDGTVTFEKISGVYWGNGTAESEKDFNTAVNSGYDFLKDEHIKEWAKIWNYSDIEIAGDDEAQLALRYSIYHLNSIAPKRTDKCGIPARGLSGQVYKGASFWDTEMFMLPFFCFTNPETAKNLVKYRVNTLEGAKRKAAEFGKEGAFYAWESQETGDDACTLFNITDIFTDRPLRTYFKDKQIHISADVVYGIWYYCSVTQDYSVLRDGGLETMRQCMWFFYSYSSFKKYKDRYELLDVVGPDEYHERVDNNAFTNCMVFHAAKIFVKAIEKVREIYPKAFAKFAEKNSFDWAYDFAEKLYVPAPDKNGIIEQFDGYMSLEDVDVETVRGREIKENEYWGCHGIASTTRVLKQADVIMMLNVFKNEYSKDIKKANWEFYEPYTEHGSSLSACAYAIVAADIGYTDWAYKYFMKTAEVDLSGNSRQYLGSLYIGGTHPAANGGSWNTAVFGFGGVSYRDDSLDISPNLPKQWKSISFKLIWHGILLHITADGKNVFVDADRDISNMNITVYGKRISER